MLPRDILSRARPVMPVVELPLLEHAVPLAHALLAGGITTIEITLRSECALAAMALVNREVPALLVGAGTVVNPAQLRQVAAAGARFAISPGISAELIAAASTESLAWIPGVATASDIMLALAAGLNAVKLFPAEVVGGVKVLQAFAGPFSELKFCPTGGINENNYRDYLSLPNVACVGGSWIAPRALIMEQRWEEIAQRARAACAH